MSGDTVDVHADDHRQRPVRIQAADFVDQRGLACVRNLCLGFDQGSDELAYRCNVGFPLADNLGRARRAMPFKQRRRRGQLCLCRLQRLEPQGLTGLRQSREARYRKRNPR